MNLKALSLNFLVAVAALQIAVSTARAEQARFLVSDKDALSARFDMIRLAKHEIFFEYFSVWNDNESLSGLAYLAQAAQRGVKVKIMIDSLSSRVPISLYAALLEKSVGPDGQRNIEIRHYNPTRMDLTNISNRDHAKMLIVDGQILLTGGRNIGDKYFGKNSKHNYVDLDILLKGPIAQEARKNFLATWNSSVVKTPYMTSFAEDKRDPVACAYEQDYENCINKQKYANTMVDFQQSRMKSVFLQALKTQGEDPSSKNLLEKWFDPAYNVESVKLFSHGTEELVSKNTAYLSHDLIEALGKARHSVTIVSPYFIPTKEMMELFGTLKARNVRVRVLTNSLKTNDHLVAHAGYLYEKPKLVKMGLEIYEYKGPNTMHTKTFLIDEEQVLIGTFNMDPRSSYLNREILVSIMDKAHVGFAASHAKILETFFNDSVLTAKDGQEYNLEWQTEGVSASTLALLRTLVFTVPLFKNQL